MKKSTIFLLTLAVTAMIIGGSGALFYYQQSAKSRDQIKNTYAVKNTDSLKEMHLTLAGNETYSIQTSDNNTITFETESAFRLVSEVPLYVKEAQQKIDVNVHAVYEEKRKEGIWLSLGVGVDYFSKNIIRIPSSVQKLVIDTKNGVQSVELDSLETPEIAMDVKEISVDLSNVSADKLNIKTTQGNIYAYNDIKVKNAQFTSTHGDISLDTFAFDQVEASTDSGRLSFTNGKGYVVGTTGDGNIQVANLKGRGTFTSENGDFTLNTPEIPKQLDVTLKYGNIDVDAQEIFHDIDIKGESELGQVTILSNKRDTYKTGSGNNHFNLKSHYGDIKVFAPSEEDDEEDE
jgi:hypothetical protein